MGTINGNPFLVPCSLAWDAALVRSFERSPVRGILPYVHAGAYELLEYEPQEITAELDTGEALTSPDPIVFTIANLTQYGGGAMITADAQPDNGLLELVVARCQDIPTLVANLHRLLTGGLAHLPRVVFRRFQSLVVRRPHAAQTQIDGELVDGPRELHVQPNPAA